MKRTLALLLLGAALQAQTIGTLFRALKQNPSVKIEDLAIMKAKVTKGRIDAGFYPTFDLTLGVEQYNRPTSLLPLPPNKILPMVQDPKIAQPFGKRIERIGVTASMPLFVKSLFTESKRAKLFQRSAQKRRKLVLLEKEALLVGSVAQWHYLESRAKALEAKAASLHKSMEMVQLKVKTGRAAESVVFKLQEALDRVEIAQNNLKIEMEEIRATLYTLTGIVLDAPVAMHQIEKVRKETLFALEPLKEKARADALALKAKKERLWPSLVAKGSYFSNHTDAYNNDQHVHEGYGSCGLYLKMPLFDKSRYAEIDQVNVTYRRSRMQIQKAKLELEASAKRIEATLPLLKSSLKAAKRSARNQKKLLDIAQVAFAGGRMSEEEYLRYEDARSDAEANVAALEAKRWQMLAQFAVLYGNSLEGIIK